MPSKFKALATISAWVLFIFGWVDLLGSTWGYINSGPVGRTPAFDFVGLWALAAAFFILSVVAMKLRQMLE
jgi:hypothetical protein